MSAIYRHSALFLALAVLVFACSSPSSSATSDDNCTPAVSCPGAADRTYSACTSHDGAHCSLKTNGNDVIDCNGCSDCASAVMKAASWCTGGDIDGGSTGGDGGRAGTDGGGSLSPDATCSLLLECLSTNVPNGFAAALAAYGPSGSCWTTPGASEACHNACQSSLAQYEKSGTCCESDSTCSTAAPHCDATKHTCEKCPFDCCGASDCKGGGVCNPASHTCGCGSDSECTGPGKGYCDPGTHACEACPFGCCGASDCGGGICDPTTHACVECESTADCGGSILGTSVCNTTTKKCVGCLSNTNCPNELFSPSAHVCNLTTDTCVECVSDGTCATGHCSADGYCVCLADGDCGGGGLVCRPGGTCDSCATDTQCSGTTPHCGFDTLGVKTCGQCSVTAQCGAGLHCLDQICTTKNCFYNSDCGTIATCNSAGQCVH